MIEHVVDPTKIYSILDWCSISDDDPILNVRVKCNTLPALME